MSGRQVFVTGGSGFVGRRLIAALVASGHAVIALDRSGNLNVPAGSTSVRVTKGDLLDPASYRAALKTCDVVVHLAAVTGRAPADEHHRVNALGTEALLNECRAAGVSRFIFVSSIAATFPDVSGYPYAIAKQRAEQAVSASGLRFLIVRPTMILGPQAPLLASLEKLATLPIAVIPGNGRARVQPVHVDDVVRCLLNAIGTDSLGDEVITLGGRDVVSMEAVVRQIRLARRGTAGPLVRLPLALFLVPVRLAEAFGLARLLPITAGQLSSFRHDGVAQPNRFQPAELRGLDAMIDIDAKASVPEDALASECEVFARYLIGQPANEYVLAKYREAHASIPGLAPRGSFDSFLVSFARRGRVFAKVADAYAASSTHSSALRKKLVLVLAILETCPPYYRQFDEPLGGGRLGAVAQLAAAGLISTLSLIIGAIILVPARIVLAIGGGDK